MKTSNIKSEEDILTYIEGCVNDFEAGLSTKDETIEAISELVVKVADLSKQKYEINQCTKAKRCKYKLINNLNNRNIQIVEAKKAFEFSICSNCNYNNVCADNSKLYDTCTNDLPAGYYPVNCVICD